MFAKGVMLVGVAAVVAVLMEPWSRFVHARGWHGPLYWIHRTHHPQERRRTWLELNDVFSLVHAVPAMVALYLGGAVLQGASAVLTLGLGLGLTVYGLAYGVVHDGLVHRRLPVGFLERWRYFRRLRAAHEVHHRDGGPPFGLFRGPQELRRATRKGRRDPRSAAPR